LHLTWFYTDLNDVCPQESKEATLGDQQKFAEKAANQDELVLTENPVSENPRVTPPSSTFERQSSAFGEVKETNKEAFNKHQTNIFTFNNCVIETSNFGSSGPVKQTLSSVPKNDRWGFRKVDLCDLTKQIYFFTFL